MSHDQGCQCGQAHGACASEYQYAVKVVCGQATVETPNAPVAAGQYYTAINIHNPNKCKDANFRIKVAIALQALPNPVSQYFGPLPLGPDGALEIDCSLIRLLVSTLYKPPSMPAFIKGFFVIESDVELDVVAVYTGAEKLGTPLITFQTERVPARCVPLCEDLVLPLHTGVAAWQTISPPPLGPAVTLVGPFNPNWTVAPPFGSSWISQSGSDVSNAPNSAATVRSYQLCFELCSGFTPPAQLQIQALADNSATLSLNGSAVGNIPGFATMTTLAVAPGLLRAGRNCFQVNVTNAASTQNNPTGFALAGILQVARGKCPCETHPAAAGRSPAHDTSAQQKMAAALFDGQLPKAD